MDNITALRARDDLLAIAASWDALRARLRPSGGTPDGVHTAPGSRPPISIEVSDVLHQVEQHARFLGQVLLDETHDFEPTTSTMPGLLVEVAHRYGHFTSGPDVEEKTALDFTDMAHELRRKVAGTIARHEPARWAGPCPEGECAGEIYQRAGSTDAKCRVCGRVVGPAEWRELMEIAFADRLMSVSELTSALFVTDHKVPIETIRTWVKRGRLVPVVEDPDLFRFADGHELAELRARRRTA